MTDPRALAADFDKDAAKAHIEEWPCPIQCEIRPAPHQKPRLPPGMAAVYVFSLSAVYGRNAACGPGCGPGTVLKVGQAGAGNEDRFKRMHYRPHALSVGALAASLLAHPVLWPWLGITHLDATTVVDWMLTNLDRTHFFIPAGHPIVVNALEVYIRARVGSVYEGAGARGKTRD
jgi:hypothetical protein